MTEIKRCLECDKELTDRRRKFCDNKCKKLYYVQKKSQKKIDKLRKKKGLKIPKVDVKSYMGNPKLKKIGEKIEWTEDMAREYRRCAEDILYFAANYYKIVNIDKGLITIPLYDFQKEMVIHYQNNRNALCLCSRQVGKTTTSCIFILHHILFNAHKSVAILANKGATSREILSRVQLAYEHLPKWLQQGIVEWNKGNIELENGSKVLSGTTTSDSIRGFACSTLFIDECAFISPNHYEEFFRSVYPTISSGQKSKIIMISTANGYNHFYKLVDDARKNKSDFKLFEVKWSDVPGRDEAWKEAMIRNTSEEDFEQEHENQFLGGSNTLIKGSKIKSLVFQTPVMKTDSGINVYKKVEEGEEYIVVSDVAEGNGGDYSTVSVIKVSSLPYEQVATYRSNVVSPYIEFPEVIHKLSEYYNQAYVLIETNISVGRETANILHDELENENVLMTITKPGKGQQISGGFAGKTLSPGVKMTKSVKRIGCSKLKDLIEKDILIINDFETISEISTFVKKLTSYAAQEPNHDDMIMGLVLFGWFTVTEYFKANNGTFDRNKLYHSQIKEVEEDLMPLGFFPDSYN